MLLGTPLWMAPELIRGVSANTPESDVYSFDMVLYEVFSAKEPYEGEYHEDIIRQIASKTVSKRPTIPRKCPREAASLMTACWDGEPSLRPKASELDVRLKMMAANQLDAINENKDDVDCNTMAKTGMREILETT